MTDQEALLHIKGNYHGHIVEAVAKWPGRAEVIAGIMMRETRGGMLSSKWYKDVDGVEDGDPADNVGDMGHGHGLMQIDDRSFPQFIESGNWRDARLNIMFGAMVLFYKTRFFKRREDHFDLLPGWTIERLGIAAYNCGEGNVLKAVNKGENPDLKTAHGDYSAAVLNYAELYSVLLI